ncbi:MAG: fructosamine kinase family protein [Treponemataceae bacterium]|nr:fructosamine kinase family protein [Treponemataceae bacterium]
MKNVTTIPHYNSLASALTGLFGNSVAILHTDRISGGDINKAYGITLNTGDHIFMKANEKDNIAFFTTEAAGLQAIADTNTIKTPKILCTGTDDGEYTGYSFLMLEYINSTNCRKDYWETFAQELAAMHSANTEGFVTKLADDKPDAPVPHGTPATTATAPVPAQFGFYRDNFIGATPQKNTPAISWCNFFRDCRLVPQFRAADSYFTPENRSKITKLLDNLDQFLIEPEHPSLLHGDLWSGNVMTGSDGKALLIDPACYTGHREADLAMTELFGGFPPKFYEAYREAAPLQAGYKDRRDLYNLYQLLNHLNLFGSSYLEPVLSIIEEYV